MTIDKPDRLRKFRAMHAAMAYLFLGFVVALWASKFKDIGNVAIGLYVPFATAISGVLTAFVVGNVQVHKSQAEAGSAEVK